jgi:hypothetical protein
MSNPDAGKITFSSSTRTTLKARDQIDAHRFCIAASAKFHDRKRNVFEIRRQVFAIGRNHAQGLPASDYFGRMT